MFKRTTQPFVKQIFGYSRTAQFGENRQSIFQKLKKENAPSIVYEEDQKKPEKKQ